MRRVEAGTAWRCRHAPSGFRKSRPCIARSDRPQLAGAAPVREFTAELILQAQGRSWTRRWRGCHGMAPRRHVEAVPAAAAGAAGRPELLAAIAGRLAPAPASGTTRDRRHAGLIMLEGFCHGVWTQWRRASNSIGQGEARTAIAQWPRNPPGCKHTCASISVACCITEIIGTDGLAATRNPHPACFRVKSCCATLCRACPLPSWSSSRLTVDTENAQRNRPRPPCWSAGASVVHHRLHAITCRPAELPAAVEDAG